MKTNVIGKYVIVRCRDAGVHAGVLIDFDGRSVILRYSRRLWLWCPKNGKWLDAVALYGLADGSKLGPTNPGEKVLTEDCEIIECSSEGEASIRKYPNA